MHLKFTAAALLGLLALSQGQARTFQEIRQSGVLRIGADKLTYAPFTIVENGKVVAGMEYELVNAIAAELGLRPQWILTDFDGIINGLNNGRYDIVAASMTPTDARKKVADFSTPTYCSGTAFISRTGGPVTAQALSGKRVAVRRNSTQFTQMNGINGLAEVGGFRSEQEAFHQMLYGRYEATALDQLIALDYLKKYPKDVVVGPAFAVAPANLAVAKNQPLLLNAVNAALKSVRDKGIYSKISAKYFPQSIDCRTP